MLAFRNSVNFARYNFAQYDASRRTAVPAEDVDAYRDWSRGRQIAFKRGSGRVDKASSPQMNGCLMADHKRLCTAEKGRKDGIPGFIRMWRSGDKWSKTNNFEGFLPNYWAKCLLIRHGLHALRIAKGSLASVQ